jgi:hypothetical protein
MVRQIVGTLRYNVDHLRKETSSLVGNLSIAAGLGRPMHLSAVGAERAVTLKEAAENAGQTWIDVGNSRAYVQTLRVALIYAVADGSPVVDLVHLNAAADFVGYANRGLRKIATTELKDPTAARILVHMREAPHETLTRTGISQNIFSRNVPAKDLENAIRLLLKLGLLTSHLEPTAGRPRTVYRLVTR